MSRESVAWLVVLVAVLAGLACNSRRERGPCLAEDLGRFHFQGLRSRPGGGCLARYRDDSGAEVIAEVAPGRPELVDREARPVKFERHVVRERRRGADTEVSWRHGRTGLRLLLRGQAVAQGPVLRAYLFHYPSQVEADLAELERQARQLHAQGGRRAQAARAHLAAAEKWLEAGKAPLALQELHAALDADRLCADCYRKLYDIYFEKAQWDLAIRAARRLAGLQPGQPGPHALLGDVYFQVQNGQLALTAYRRALELGLSGEDGRRVRERVARLEGGLYMIKVLRRPLHKAAKPSEDESRSHAGGSKE